MLNTISLKRTTWKVRFALCLVLATSIVGLTFANAASTAFPKTPIYGENNSHILVSQKTDRSNPVTLDGKTLPASPTKSYIFVKDENVNDAYFYLDSKLTDSQLTRANATEEETTAPFDMQNSIGQTRVLSAGTHNLRVVIVWKDGYVSLKKVTFTVAAPIVTTTTTTTTTTTLPPTTTTTRPPTTTTTVPPTTQPPVIGPGKAGYTLVYNEEFDGSVGAGGAINGWSYTTGSLNRDIACYTKNNVSVSGGALHILTKAENAGCAAPDNQFSVGEITSSKRVDPKSISSGVIRIEMRAQMPDFTQNVWPGLWTRNGDYGGVYGEADLIEQWGDDQSYYGSDAVLVTTHNGCGGCNMLKGTFKTGIALDKSFNDYAVEIDTVKNEIRYYFGSSSTPISVHKASQYAAGSAAQNNFITMLKGAWNAKLTMQVAEKSQWHDTANPSTFKTTDLKVDYVRMYTKN